MIFMRTVAAAGPCYHKHPMRLRTRLNLVVAGLSAAFVTVLIAAEIQSNRASVREEVEAANGVAAHLLGRLASIYSNVGGPDMVLQFLQQLGRVRANEVTLLSPAGEVIYRSPLATYKAGREAPDWFAHLMAPRVTRVIFPLRGGVRLIIDAQPSRAVLDAWDDITHLTSVGVAMLVVVNTLAFWSVARALKPFPVIADGLERIQRGELAFRLPPLAGEEANTIGVAFNRMAQAVEDKVQAELQVHDAEARLEERREMASLADQRVEEERRLIAHELHDEFGQSVTAIRSLALAPLSLDVVGLTAALENLTRDWQRRHPALALSLHLELPQALAADVTLAIYRVVQEGVTNALRHAQASRVDIDVRGDPYAIRVCVADDGLGLPDEWSRPGHFGLRGLSDRVQQVEGTFEIGNRESGGARLTAVIPLEPAA